MFLLVWALHVMAGRRGKIQPVDLLQLVNDRNRGLVEGDPLLECVQHDALKEVTEREI